MSVTTLVAEVWRPHYSPLLSHLPNAHLLSTRGTIFLEESNFLYLCRNTYNSFINFLCVPRRLCRLFSVAGGTGARSISVLILKSLNNLPWQGACRSVAWETAVLGPSCAPSDNWSIKFVCVITSFCSSELIPRFNSTKCLHPCMHSYWRKLISLIRPGGAFRKNRNYTFGYCLFPARNCGFANSVRSD